MVYYNSIPETNDRHYAVCADEWGQGGAMIQGKNGQLTSHVCPPGTIVHGKSVNPPYMDGCIESGKFVFIGLHISGGMGRDFEIEYRSEIKSAAGGVSIDLSNPRWFPLLRELAKKDLKSKE